MVGRGVEGVGEEGLGRVPSKRVFLRSLGSDTKVGKGGGGDQGREGKRGYGDQFTPF